MIHQLHTASLVLIVAFEVFGSFFCLGRLISRLISVRVRKWRGLMMWSDICMMGAWVLSVGETVSMYKVTQVGHYGYRLSDVQKMPFDFTNYSLVYYVNSLFYYPVLGLVKASMVLLYLRLGGTKRGVEIGCYVLLFILFIHTVGTSVADIFQCSPVRYVWDRIALDQAAQAVAGANESGVIPEGILLPSGFKNGVYIAGGQCYNLEYFLVITAAFSILTDLLMLLIPIYMVYDLQLTPKKKAVVLLVLCMGLGVTAVGAIRLQIIWTGYHQKPGQDPNFSVRSTISMIETDLALVTACIPDLFPLIRRFFPNFLRSDSHVLEPNPYPYISHSGSGSGLRSSTVSESRSSYSRRIRKILSPSTSQNMTSIDEEMDIAYGMETYNWRGDNVRGPETEVKGGAEVDLDAIVGSQETDIGEVIDGNVKGIVKTTQFTVEEGDAKSEYEKKWSDY